MKININNKLYFKSIYPDININNENLSIYIINQLKKRNDKVILVDENSNKLKSYQFISNIEKVTTGIQNLLNLNKGDKVGVLLPSYLEFTYCVLGIILGGGIVSQINSNSTKEEIKNTLSTVLPKYIIINYSNYNRIKDHLVELFPNCEAVVIVPDNNNNNNSNNSNNSNNNKHHQHQQNALNYQATKTLNLNLIMNNNGTYNKENSKSCNDDDIALILFSSGTTGNFKGVCLSHLNLLFAIHQITLHEYSHHLEPQRILCCIPLFHIYGFVASFLTGISYGSCLYFINTYNIKKVLQIIQDAKITLSFIVPSIGIEFAKSDQVLKYDCSSLKTLLSGGSTFPNDIIGILESRFGNSTNESNESIKNLKIRQGYGCTEGCNLSHSNVKYKIKNGSSGFIGANMILKVVDIDNSNINLDCNQIGELCFKGPNIMKEYFNNLNATKESFDNEGFFLTGDIGYIDNDGDIFLVDRKKELIKSNGYHVSPTEIESILLNHPKIQEVCVVGIPSNEYGELIKAFIVLKDRNSTRSEIHKWLNKRVSSYKSLSGGIVFIDNLPKSSTGKVLRKILKPQSKL